jgi:hypothetical protein
MKKGYVMKIGFDVLQRGKTCDEVSLPGYTDLCQLLWTIPEGDLYPMCGVQIRFITLRKRRRRREQKD